MHLQMDANVHMDAYKYARMHACRHAWGDGRMDGWTDPRMDGWTDGRVDGWTHGWTDTDGRTDGRIYIYRLFRQREREMDIYIAGLCIYVVYGMWPVA